MRFTILTLFPEYFSGPLSCSLMGRAISQNLLSVDLVSLRSFGEGKYRAVDDRPFGGGPGMVMAAPVLERALAAVLDSASAQASSETLPKTSHSNTIDALAADVQRYRRGLASGVLPEPFGLLDSAHSRGALPFVIYLSPQGQQLTPSRARQLLVSSQHFILICGHYEGVDERFLETFVHQEISVGDYILTGGEPAALTLLDVLSRFIDGVVGDPLSVTSDTFEAQATDVVPGGLKYPVYTRPAHWRGLDVPPVLVSGDHKEISKWRVAQSEERTRQRRPDLGLPGPKR